MSLRTTLTRWGLLSVLATGGAMLAFLSGLANAMLFNPLLSDQSALPSVFLSILGLLLIFATDTHHLMLMALLDSYMLFQVSQYDQYSYLFAEPHFITLNPSTVNGIPLEGMRIGINGKEALAGQPLLCPVLREGELCPVPMPPRTKVVIEPLPVVIDHMGRVKTKDGVGQEAFQLLLGLLREPLDFKHRNPLFRFGR